MVDILRTIQDPFYPIDEREEIFSSLKSLWDNFVGAALHKLNSIDLANIDIVVKTLRFYLADFFPPDYSIGATESVFDRARREVYADAADRIAKDTIFVVEGLSESEAIAVLNGQLSISAGGFYDSQLSESIKNSLLDLHEGDLTQEEIVQRTKKLVNEKLAGERVLSDAYFERLTNFYVMRVRNIGKYSTAKALGSKGYKLINPMDNRTSPICRALVARDKVYPIEALDPVVTSILEAQTTDEQKAAYPFWKSPDEDRPPIGPFHWGDCRTILVPQFL
jgi:hypothetical protein